MPSFRIFEQTLVLTAVDRLNLRSIATNAESSLWIDAWSDVATTKLCECYIPQSQRWYSRRHPQTGMYQRHRCWCLCHRSEALASKRRMVTRRVWKEKLNLALTSRTAGFGVGSAHGASRAACQLGVGAGAVVRSLARFAAVASFYFQWRSHSHHDLGKNYYGEDLELHCCWGLSKDGLESYALG